MRGNRPSSSAQAVTLARAHLDWLGVVDDPHARTMLRRGPALAARLLHHRPFDRYGRSPTVSWLAARTLFFDGAVRQALDDGATQVVIVGAGYDSRAWRLARPGARFFEVDHPATQAAKRAIAPPDGPTYVAADLRDESLVDVLPASGFDRDVPAVFVVEGVTMYLSRSVVADLLTQLATLGARGSRLAINFSVGQQASPSLASRLVGIANRSVKRVGGEPLDAWAQPEVLAELFAASEWEPVEQVTGSALVARYLSDSQMPTSGVAPGATVVSAQRRQPKNAST